MGDPFKPEIFDVPVVGGLLRVGKWGSGPVVLAAHGITASHMQWPRLAEQLDGRVTLVAPDLRGRGGSNDLAGPYGMAVHAADLVSVLDFLGVKKAPILGHSMGAFVATAASLHYPERVMSLVLADGGIRLFDVSPDADVDMILQTLLGPSMQRLDMAFPSEQAYFDFWRQHPSFKDEAWDRYFEAYLEYDLTGEEPNLRSRVSKDAVREDSADTLLNEEISLALEKLQCPAVLIRAPRGVLNEPKGLYSDDVAKEWTERVRLLTDELVPDVNHYMLLLGERGASAVARHVVDAVEGSMS